MSLARASAWESSARAAETCRPPRRATTIKPIYINEFATRVHVYIVITRFEYHFLHFLLLLRLRHRLMDDSAGQPV